MEQHEALHIMDVSRGVNTKLFQDGPMLIYYAFRIEGQQHQLFQKVAQDNTHLHSIDKVLLIY